MDIDNDGKISKAEWIARSPQPYRGVHTGVQGSTYRSTCTGSIKEYIWIAWSPQPTDVVVGVRESRSSWGEAVAGVQGNRR